MIFVVLIWLEGAGCGFCRSRFGLLCCGGCLGGGLGGLSLCVIVVGVVWFLFDCWFCFGVIVNSVGCIGSLFVLFLV